MRKRLAVGGTVDIGSWIHLRGIEVWTKKTKKLLYTYIYCHVLFSDVSISGGRVPTTRSEPASLKRFREDAFANVSDE